MRNYPVIWIFASTRTIIRESTNSVRIMLVIMLPANHRNRRIPQSSTTNAEYHCGKRNASFRINFYSMRFCFLWGLCRCWSRIPKRWKHFFTSPMQLFERKTLNRGHYFHNAHSEGFTYGFAKFQTNPQFVLKKTAHRLPNLPIRDKSIRHEFRDFRL